MVNKKPVYWIGSSKKDLSAFPQSVKEVMGFALHQAQTGGKHDAAKPLKGFGGGGVLEIVEDYDGDTYRGVYTVKFPNAVYALHAFQKKSTKGIRTAQGDIELIRKNLKVAEADSAAEIKSKETSNAKSR
ncbi:MAG: type II toxin-antitoxin system RelE/ParE family toxin [Proteobacteria bacterium]|nr:type II toxin-antitoxin system RelE/ParE family toxin [Pseudomonadota bacterium]